MADYVKGGKKSIAVRGRPFALGLPPAPSVLLGAGCWLLLRRIEEKGDAARTGSTLEPTPGPGRRRRVAARVRGPRRAQLTVLQQPHHHHHHRFLFAQRRLFLSFRSSRRYRSKLGGEYAVVPHLAAVAKSIADTMERSSGTGAPTVLPCRATGHARPSVRTCGWTHVSHQASLSRWSVHAFTGGSGRISAGVGGT